MLALFRGFGGLLLLLQLVGDGEGNALSLASISSYFAFARQPLRNFVLERVRLGWLMEEEWRYALTDDGTMSVIQLMGLYGDLLRHLLRADNLDSTAS